MPMMRLLISSLAVLFVTHSVHAEDCQSVDGALVDSSRRREAAFEYISAVNSAQALVQKRGGRYSSLNELTNVPSAPVGFVPKLLADRWSYVVSVKDYFDACGYALFSDERGVIYEAHARTRGCRRRIAVTMTIAR